MSSSSLPRGGTGELHGGEKDSAPSTGHGRDGPLTSVRGSDSHGGDSVLSPQSSVLVTPGSVRGSDSHGGDSVLSPQSSVLVTPGCVRGSDSHGGDSVLSPQSSVLITPGSVRGSDSRGGDSVLSPQSSVLVTPGCAGLHTYAWMAWVGMVMAIALSASNPYYLGIVLFSVILVNVVAPKTAAAVAGFRTLLVFGTSLFAISMFIAVINGNYGNHVLFTIPGPDVPEWLGGLRLGGPVAAEGLVAAAIRGLAILCVLLAFGVFNGAVSPHRVLRTTPAALFHAGLVVTVGLTLLPASIEDVRRIREMRALRGAGTGVRDLPALVVPAVIGGLERSMRLAEAMEARGYGSLPAGPRGPRVIGALAAPLLLASASGWFYYPSARWVAVVLGVLGAGALILWGWTAARSRQTSVLRREALARTDAMFTVASLGLGLLAVFGGHAGWLEMTYNPFAGLPWPPFTVAGAALAGSSAWPALRMALGPAISALEGRPRHRPAGSSAKEPMPP